MVNTLKGVTRQRRKKKRKYEYKKHQGINEHHGYWCKGRVIVPRIRQILAKDQPYHFAQEEYIDPGWPIPLILTNLPFNFYARIFF